MWYLLALHLVFATMHTAYQPVLVHGVFGSGKSFFLAVLVLSLIRLFDASDAAAGVPVCPKSSPIFFFPWLLFSPLIGFMFGFLTFRREHRHDGAFLCPQLPMSLWTAFFR
jgi:hypothetical protein